ncbi:SPFH domain-containing protein [Uliginosibacterium sp. 31-16]|uniref:SPFH domain-containing protein n=1 Tax=Uliginosibacterium sp. 31-16 TaxID=3068315 RepID=UPI00273E2B76|nr:SPFH domain-containing protein [Uliginosibacterium sp. 31-16]MDP5238192.1 SPFH domain-containing protein [Uliginosibacterium sp. 31-16]
MELPRLNNLTRSLRIAFSRFSRQAGPAVAGAGRNMRGAVRPLLIVGAVGLAGYAVVKHPPIGTVARGEAGLRVNQLTGAVTEITDGSILVIPGLHRLQTYPLHDQMYRAVRSAQADGPAPFQSVEGMSLGVEISIRYALDPAKLASTVRNLPADIGGEVVEPEVQGVIYKTFTRYTVREIFSTKRGEIQQAIETELKPKLAADGILLKGVMMGKVDLPADYRRGLDQLLSEELETQKMRYTLELKEKRVKQTELESQADAVRREKAAEAAGNEQIIAAKAQAESMKHVLPFKEKQIQQRQLEADAEKISRIKGAEANAEARKIEAGGEAASRQKLADAEAYRVEVIGKASTAQLERDGALISKHPLLIQKTMADKLSDKIQVIIAPPNTSGFIGANLLGSAQPAQTQQAPQVAEEGGE